MSLFSQRIKVELDPQYVIQKVELGEIKKRNIELFVGEGTNALINNKTYGSGTTHNLIREEVVGQKGDKAVAYLYSNKFYNTIELGLYAGRFIFGLDELRTAKLEYSVVFYVSVELLDYKELVSNFRKTLTKEEAHDEIKEKLVSLLSGACSQAVAKFRTDESTTTDVNGKKQEIFKELRQTTSKAISQLGLTLSSVNQIKFNPTDETEIKIEQIRNSVNENAMDSLNDAKRERENDALQKERQHEIDMTRANNTKITESTQNINKNINGNIKEEESKPQKRFCHKCGKEITQSDAAFCPSCGAKL